MFQERPARTGPAPPNIGRQAVPIKSVPAKSPSPVLDPPLVAKADSPAGLSAVYQQRREFVGLSASTSVQMRRPEEAPTAMPQQSQAAKSGPSAGYQRGSSMSNVLSASTSVQVRRPEHAAPCPSTLFASALSDIDIAFPGVNVGYSTTTATPPPDTHIKCTHIKCNQSACAHARAGKDLQRGTPRPRPASSCMQTLTFPWLPCCRHLRPRRRRTASSLRKTREAATASNEAVDSEGQREARARSRCGRGVRHTSVGATDVDEKAACSCGLCSGQRISRDQNGLPAQGVLDVARADDAFVRDHRPLVGTNVTRN